MATKKYVPKSIQNLEDRIAAKNEREIQAAIEEPRPQTFEVVVYDTANPDTRSQISQDVSDESDTNVDNYYYYRARSLAGQHDHFLLPEVATTLEEYEKLRNNLYQGVFKKSGDGELPQTGDVFRATFLGGNLVSLDARTRKKNITPRFKSQSGSSKNSFESSTDPTGTLSDYETLNEQLGESDNPFEETYNTGDNSSSSTVSVDVAQKKLLAFISKGEGSYNASNNGTDRSKQIRNSIGGTSYVAKNFVTSTKQRDDQVLLSTMTIQEIMDLQKGRNPYFNPNASNKRTLFAVGAYQIIPDTMHAAVRDSGLSKTEVFNETNQDKLCLALIYGSKRPKLRDYLKGSDTVTLNEAHVQLAQEWASVPKPSGGTVYADTGNKASHSVQEVQDVLKEVRDLNIKNGIK